MNNQPITSYNKDRDYNQIKSEFYEAINDKNQDKFLVSLLQLFTSGRIKELFSSDERYSKFWRNRILKDQGLDGVRKFDENPVRPEILGSFIKYVLEQRFAMPPEQSVLWGVLVSALAHKAGDEAYEKLAYGDIQDQKFRWNV